MKRRLALDGWPTGLTKIAAVDVFDGTVRFFDGACARHGIHFLSDSPWTAELKRRYGLL